MEPSVEYIVAALSALRCGEAFMPLDPIWPKARILSLLSSSNAYLVIGIKRSTEENFYHRLDTLEWLIDEGSCPILPFSMKENIKEQCHPLVSGWPCESESLRSFCYLMYTSGSTGKPKGVCGTEIGEISRQLCINFFLLTQTSRKLLHLSEFKFPILFTYDMVSYQQHPFVGLLNRFLWMQETYPLHEGDVVLCKTAISFIDHMQEFLGAVLSSCTLVIPPFNQLKENIFYIVDFLQVQYKKWVLDVQWFLLVYFLLDMRSNLIIICLFIYL